MTYLAALLITLAVEVPLVVWVVRRAGHPSPGFVALVALGANLLTHGTLWTVFPHLPWSYLVAVAVAETGVVLAEAGIFAGFGLLPPGRALALSLGANAVTTAIGLLETWVG